jgi:D-alanyl-D-alanine carboxypeptidase/D-alanyl-D-alanine-endopeptidase (penicillin-binding protein 4)
VHSVNALKSMYRTTAILFVLIIAHSASATEQKNLFAEDRISSLLPQNSHWSLCVIDTGDGKEILSTGNAAKDLLIPGSLTKLFVTGTVLEHGNSDMKTAICHDGNIADGVLKGNLYLRGGGNSFLSAADLRNVAVRLSRRGIKTVNGSIVADDTFFDTNGFGRNRKGPGYAAVGALGLDLHTVAVTVTPSKPGKPPKVEVEPPYDEVRLALSALTTNTSATTLRVMQIDDASYRVTGNIPVNSGPLKWRFTLADPALFAGGVFKTLLRKEGIKIEGDVKKGNAPADIKSIVEIPGPPVLKMLRDMNFHSLNVVADNLFLVLGAEKYGSPGNKEKGLKAVKEFLASLDLPMSEVKPADGSGLSGDNRATTRFMALYLAKIRGKPWFNDFYNSLPRAGIEGTAANIGYRNDKFRVKTGMLEDAFAMAGYVVDGRGHDMAFAYIVNVPGAGVMGLERSGAEMLEILADH